MAKRWLIGGLAVGVGALVLAPESRTWLRRRLGLEPEDRRWFEEEGVETAEHEGDEPLDTRRRASRCAPGSRRRGTTGRRRCRRATVEPAPEPSAFPAFQAPPAEPSFPAFEQPAATPPPVEERIEEPAAEEPVADEPAAEEPVAEEPVTEEPVAEAAPASPSPPTEPRPRPRPARTSPQPSSPSRARVGPGPRPPPDPPPRPTVSAALEPDQGFRSFESLPAITPEADDDAEPGEDTNEIDPVPSTRAEQAAAEDDEPPPPPTLLRPPTSPGTRPFSSSEGSSFRSAIDAARERVHGTAREATPDDEGDENTEPLDERSSLWPNRCPAEASIVDVQGKCDRAARACALAIWHVYARLRRSRRFQ